MTKAQRKTLETAIIRLEKLHSELCMTAEKQAVQAAILELKKA